MRAKHTVKRMAAGLMLLFLTLSAADAHALQTEAAETSSEMPELSSEASEAENPPSAQEKIERSRGIPVLADTNGDTEVHLYAPEGHFFPVGTSFRLLGTAEAAGEASDGGEQSLSLEQRLRDMWKEGMQGERAFLAYYLMVTDSAGNELTIPDKVNVHFIIRDVQFYEDACTRTDLYRAACLGKGSEFIEITKKEIVRDDQEKAVILRMEAEKTGWICILQSEAAKLEEETEHETEHRNTDETDGAQDGLFQTEAEAADGECSDTETGGTDGAYQIPEIGVSDGEFSDTEREVTDGEFSYRDAADVELSEEVQDDGRLMPDALGVEQIMGDFGVSLMSVPASGGLVTSAGSGFEKMQPSSLDGAYRASRWYNGISSFSIFNNAGASVKKMKKDGDYQVFYPVDDTAKGKFGVFYYKILYLDGVWYDLKITVENYTNQIYTGTQGELADSYPPIGFCESAINFRFKNSMGEVLLKMEYYQNGGSDSTPSKVNTRFQWWDIDNGQRFGLRMKDGSIQAKYYQADNCEVHYLTQKAAVDGKNYLVVTAAEALDGKGDKRGNVGFALSGCSSYFVLIGEKDKIKENAEARASKANIQLWNQQLKSGNAEELSLGILMQTDVESPIPPDKAYPQKSVSNDGASWSTANVLAKVNGEYYYRIRQYVPWETSANYFSQFVIRDTLPAGVDFVGGLKVKRVEDGANVTSKFTAQTENDVVKVKADSNFLKNEGLYGYTFDVIFKARMNPGEIRPQYQENTAVYHVSNKASAKIVFAGSGTTYNNESNAADTTASAERNVQQDPAKRLDANESLTEKTLSSAGEEILFSIYQSVPQNEDAWQPSKITFRDTLADCLQYRSASVYALQNGSFVQTDGFAIANEGQTVTAVQASPPSGQTFRLDIRCNIREEYDMQPYRQVIANRYWCLIPNSAQVELAFEHGNPQSVTRQTNEAIVKVSEGPIQVRLTLRKEIDAEDIVWAHGNPTFTFRVSGEDLDGIRHTYYETVEFTPQNTGSSGKTALSAEFFIPAGWYTAAEEKTVRYQLNAIHSVAGGSASGDKAVFDLSASGEGYATFYNVKTTDEGESHSAFVRNVISAR